MENKARSVIKMKLSLSVLCLSPFAMAMEGKDNPVAIKDNFSISISPFDF